MFAPSFVLDPTGFPMVWIEQIDAYIHWYPVTKIQFERFLCDTPDSHFDAAWYDEINDLNPRVSPRNVRLDNYWQSFLTGIKPDEVERYARWCGMEYSIPRLNDWFTCYQILKSEDPIDSDPVKDVDLSPRTKDLLRNLGQASRSALHEVGYDRSLADQLLMRMGVMEWVECQNQRSRWGGMGETFPRFHGALFTPDYGQPSIPNNPDEIRLPHYGFRLIRRRR